METPDYTYQCKPADDIISELLKDKLIGVSKLSRCASDIETGGYVNHQAIAVKKIYDENEVAIKKAIHDDSNRVFNNMIDIPLNRIVRISPNTLVQRVHKGWIYIHETYSNCGASSSVIHKTSTFVAE